MAIILQLLGLVITFVMAMEALRRFGIDVGWLNPLTFIRRHRWRKQVTTPPLYTLEHPVDVVAVLALAIVQTTGLISAQQKAGVQELLHRNLNMSDADATSLWLSSSHMLRNRPLEPSEVPAVLQRSAGKFSDYHLQTLKTVMHAAAMIEPPVNSAQQQLMDAVDAFFAQRKASPHSWAT